MFLADGAILAEKGRFFVCFGKRSSFIRNPGNPEEMSGYPFGNVYPWRNVHELFRSLPDFQFFDGAERKSGKVRSFLSLEI